MPKQLTGRYNALSYGPETKKNEFLTQIPVRMSGVTFFQSRTQLEVVSVQSGQDSNKTLQ